MALTRANVEVILIDRAGPLMAEAGLDGTTEDGTNANLNEPIGWGIRQAGGTTDSVTAVDDDDVSTIGSDDYDKLFDLAEYRLLWNIRGSWANVDLSVGPRRESYSQFAKMLDKSIADKREQIQQDYNLLQGTIEAGVITLDFMEKTTTT